MNNRIAPAEQSVADQIGERLLESFRQRQASEHATFLLLQAELAESVDLPGWLASQPVDNRFYWRSRDGERELACAGYAYAVDELSPVAAIERISRYLALQPELTAIGGFRFDSQPQIIDDDWLQFPHARFLIPHLTLETAAGRQRVRLVLPNGPLHERQVDREIKAACQTFLAVSDLSRPCSRQSPPERSVNRPVWNAQIEQALAAIREGRITKLVLSRTIDLSPDQIGSPWQLISMLKPGADGTTLYAFSPTAAGPVFLGASPERLYRRFGRTIEADAMAGTRLPTARQFTPKDEREHRPVEDHLVSALTPLCELLYRPTEPHDQQFRHLAHICSRVSGTLREEIADAAIVGALHPTPAVAGFPVSEAIALIRQIESHDRGWYAGAVGLISADESEFTVAIRSALVFPEQMRLFVGAGIVDGSTADGEWEETATKSRPIRDLFDS